MTGYQLRPRQITGSPLVLDYLYRHEKVAPFYNGSPYLIESFRRKAAALRDRFDADRRATAARLFTPTSAHARSRLDAWVESEGLVVTTGQQAGFLGGPLFTLYKALSTAHLAHHLESVLGLPVIPVFWIASDDHDWAEVDHAVLLDREGRAFRSNLPAGDPRPLPMSKRPLPDGVNEILDEVLQRIGGQPHARSVVKWIRDSYSGDRTVAAAFRELLFRVLGSLDMYLVEGADPELKGASRWVVKEALEQAEAHEGVVEERTQALEAAGYRGQVSLVPRGTNVFRCGEAGRERLFRVGEDFGTRGAARRLFERGELLAELEAAPARFSPNVLLRPVVESAVMPTVAYVGGPGEMAYFAQANALFGGFGLEPPVVVPRFSGVVVEERIEGLMEGLGLTEEELEKPREELRDRLAREEMPAEVKMALDRIREGLAGGYREVIDGVLELDPTLAGAIGAMRNRSLGEAARAERKVVRAIKRREGVTLHRLDRVLDAQRPMGRPQERVLGMISPLARWGEGFLEEVLRVIAEAWRVPGGSEPQVPAPRAVAAPGHDGE